MKRISTAFSQWAIVLIGMSAFVFMFWEPHLEGRNAHSTLFEIYFKDPFLAYAYASSTLFFVALCKAFKLFGYMGQDGLFSLGSLKALRTIRDCAVALIILIVGAEAYLFIIQRSKDDIVGGVAMGLFMFFVFSIVAISATMFERHLQKKF